MYSQVKTKAAGERVCGQWAKQSAESVTLQSIQLRGKSIYSYGNHYLLGKIMQFNGRKIAAVNFTRYSSTTSSHSRSAKQAAIGAGLVVGEFNILSGPGITSYSSDAEIRAAIKADTYRKQAELLDRLATISYSVLNTWKVRFLLEQVEEFNKNMAALGLKNMAIIVPDFYLKDALLLARANMLASGDHATRKQTVFSLFGDSKTILAMPGYYERKTRMYVS